MEAEISYREIEEILEQILGSEVKFETVVEQLMSGETLFDMKMITSVFQEVLLQQLQNYMEFFGYLLLLLLSAAILFSVTRAFRNHQISDMGFYMIYLLLMLLLMQVFGACYEMTETLIRDLLDFMKVLMPAYLMAAAAASYRTSAAVYYEGFMLLTYYLQKLVLYIILPIIRGYCLLVLAGHLGSSDFFSGGRVQIKRLIGFLLKGILAVSVGLQFIQGMITPAIDSVQQTVFNKGVSSLGSLGNVTQGVMDVILGSGIILKNGIGAAAAIMILIICLFPAVRVGSYIFFLSLLAVVTEPVSDKRLIGAVSEMSEGLGLLVRLQFTVAALFLLTIAVVCVTTGGIR